MPPKQPARLTIEELLQALEADTGHPLDPEQRAAISHGDQPLLIAAGPGTGKTEVLVARCLKFLCCNRADPASIILTTFTRRPARSLTARLQRRLRAIQQAYPQLDDINLSQLRIGTLDSLAQNLLQEFNYSGTRNTRPLNEMQAAFLIWKQRTVEPAAQKPARQEIINQIKAGIPEAFSYASSKLWSDTLGLQQLFDRISDQQLSVDLMNAGTPGWPELAQEYRQYRALLETRRLTTFATRLEHFLAFLRSQEGSQLLQGRTRSPAITHILVDEYQDTNPLQEAIYQELASQPPHRITAVGDDDQAIYRFRGGTVASMVGFASYWKEQHQTETGTIFLNRSHRSGPEITTFLNTYLAGLPQMQRPGARIADKPPLEPRDSQAAAYPAVSRVERDKPETLARELARLLQTMHEQRTVSDYSDCVLLASTSRAGKKGMYHYEEALRNAGIPVFNPRAKNYFQQVKSPGAWAP